MVAYNNILPCYIYYEKQQKQTTLDEKKGGYGKVDRAIIEDPTLTPESRLIYACLACYADKKRSCYQVLKH